MGAFAPHDHKIYNKNIYFRGEKNCFQFYVQVYTILGLDTLLELIGYYNIIVLYASDVIVRNHGVE